MTDEGFEAFHVPQQSRRDKLRVVVVQSTHHHYNSQQQQQQQEDDEAYNHPDHHHHRFLPTAALYDPSESDDDLLPTTHCPANPLVVEDHLHHHANFKFQQAIPLVSLSTPSSSSPCLAVVKEEEDLGLGVNLMPGFGNGVGGDGGRSLIINPSCSSVQDMNNLIHTTTTTNNNNHPYDLYTASSIDNLRNYFNHHQQQQQQQQSFNIDHRDQVAMAATTTTLFRPQTLNNSNNFSYEPRTNILQAGGGGGGGLSLSLSSSSHPQNNNNNSHRAAAALELNNLVSPPLRYHNQPSMMFGADKIIGSGYLFRGEGGGGGAGGSASVLTSNDCRSSKGGISSTSSRVSSPNLEGPFTGYTSILKESRFLKPAQLLLEENCDIVTNEGMYHRDHVDDHTTMMSEGGGKDSSSMSNLMDTSTSQHQMMLEKLSESGRTNGNNNGVIGGGRNGGGNRHTSTSSSEQNHHQTSKKTTRLISMLDEVYRRYKHYYQQMVATVTSFESVAGLGNAAPYTSFALQAMSKHFRCLKNAITDQLYFTNKDYSVERSLKKDEYPRFGKTDPHIHSQRSAHDAAFLERQNVWRPQRGLPEHAVAVLRAWLFEHFLHPYPTDNDKQMLAKQTGLSRSQVSNWFINARVRLWKPMVEEIHMLETRQTEKGSEVEDQNIIKLNEPLNTAATNPLPSDHQQPQSNPTFQQVHNPPLKRSRNELPPLVPNKSSNDQMMNFSCNNLSSYHQHVSVGGISSNTGANSGVSLTLGLRQNNGTGLSGAASSFPLNVARRFGIEADNEGYVIGSGFEASNNRMNYGKDIGGQLLHDFVG